MTVHDVVMSPGVTWSPPLASWVFLCRQAAWGVLGLGLHREVLDRAVLVDDHRGEVATESAAEVEPGGVWERLRERLVEDVVAEPDVPESPVVDVGPVRVVGGFLPERDHLAVPDVPCPDQRVEPGPILALEVR